MTDGSWRVVGHAQAKRYAEQQLATGAFPQAVLYVGPEAVGKRVFAREVAERLGAHTESVLECDGAAASVQEVRDFLDRLALRPVHAPVQVAIFDHAEALSAVMANTLLKVLEEPPSHTYFFLIASRASILPTIMSRCTRIAFGMLTREECARIAGPAWSDDMGALIRRLGPGAVLASAGQAEQVRTWHAEWDALLQFSEFNRMTLLQRLAAEDALTLGHRLRVWLACAQEMAADARYAHRLAVLQEALRRLQTNANRKLVMEYVCLSV